MGFSDTATYIRTDQPDEVPAALSAILTRYGYRPARSVSSLEEPVFTGLGKTSALLFGMEVASAEFVRLYSSQPGIFADHEGDYIPILQKLAAFLNTDAFEIAVNDGDSIDLLETDGAKCRLTGCHSHVLDEIYRRKGELKIAPGEIYPFRHVQFPYQSLRVDAELVPEVITYEFGHDLESAISDFEQSIFGQALPSNQDFELEPPEASENRWVFGYELKG